MMKKITLLFLIAFSILEGYSQVVDTFFMNYAFHELNYADNTAGTTGNSALGGAIINKNFPNQQAANMTWIMTDFNTIGYSLTDGSFFQYPSSGFQLELDSFDFTFYNVKTDNAFDTLTITVYDYSSVSRDAQGIPVNPTISGTILWQEKLAFDTALLGANDFANRTTLAFAPNLTLAPDQTFSIHMDYDGDTSNYIVPAYTFSATCNDGGAQTSQFPFNTNYYVPFTGLEGVWPNGVVFTGAADGCDRYTVQNWNISTYIRSTNDVNVNLTSNQSEFIEVGGLQCDGDQVQLNVNSIGIDASNANNFEVSWSPAGLVSDPTILNPTHTVGTTPQQNIVFTLTDTVNNVEYKDSVTILSFAMTADAGADVTVLCGAETNIVPSASIATLGGEATAFTWNANDDNGILITSTSGTYTVTATNTAGCTATDDVNVNVQGENNINFTFSSGTNCIDNPITFTNASTKKAGWNFEWFIDDVLDANTEEFTYTFNAANSYNIKLTADSATCSYEQTKSITIDLCLEINELDFSNELSISPNPSTDAFTIAFELNNASDVEISLTSLDGKIVDAYQYSNVSTVSQNFATNNLSSGFYIVKVKTDKGITTRNIIVSNK